jgi:hypothetical protein
MDKKRSKDALRNGFVLLYSNTKSGVVPPHSKAASAAVGNN